MASDADAVWRVLEPMLRDGETYPLPRDMTRTDALSHWLGPDHRTFVADAEGKIMGTYYLRANQLGGGAHVANCGYVTYAAARGRGVARAMCLHSLDEARRLGFRAMQFNFVVSTNEVALRLWKSLGFNVVGRLPGAFAHRRFGYVDAFVQSRPQLKWNEATDQARPHCLTPQLCDRRSRFGGRYPRKSLAD